MFLKVVHLAQDRFSRYAEAVCLNPLQVTNPKSRLCQLESVRIDLNTVELPRPNLGKKAAQLLIVLRKPKPLSPGPSTFAG